MPPQNRPQVPTSNIRIEGDLPKSNAFADQDEVIKKPRVKVVRRKKGLGRSISEVFLGEDAQNVMDYILHDVLIPAAKSMISDAIAGGLDLALFGEKRRDRTKRDRGQSRVSYSGYYKDREEKKERTHRRRGRNMDDLVFPHRAEAEDVLTGLLDLLDEYEQVSIADLYDLIGVSSDDFTDKENGWTNLARATVDRVRGGYLLNLPRPIGLD